MKIYLAIPVFLAIAFPSLAACPTMRIPADHVCYDDGSTTAQDAHDTQTCSHFYTVDKATDASSAYDAAGDIGVTPTAQLLEQYDPRDAWATGTSGVMEWCWTSPDGEDHTFSFSMTMMFKPEANIALSIFSAYKSGTGVGTADKKSPYWYKSTVISGQYYTMMMKNIMVLSDGDCVGVILVPTGGATIAINSSAIELTQLDCRDDGT